MQKIVIAIVAALSCGSALAQDEAEETKRLDLVCLGEGSANRTTSSTVYATNSYGESGRANIVGNSREPFEDQVNLWISLDEGRLRMPRTMLPTLRGGEDGWFKIKNLEVSDTEITGSIAVNLINNPQLRIDRVTGLISISGRSGRYLGHCVRYDAEFTQRAF